MQDGNIGCGVFVDSLKAFDFVEHQILLANLNRCGIRGVSNDCFKSYLSNRSQSVSINGYHSGLAAIDYGVPQGSISSRSPTFFFIYKKPDSSNKILQSLPLC